MKNKNQFPGFLIFLGFLFLSAILFTACSRKNDSAKIANEENIEESIETEIDEKPIEGHYFSEEAVFESNNDAKETAIIIKGTMVPVSDDYIDRIEVIGWSRSGLLAYRYVDDGGAYGGMSYRFEIINTVDDKIIEQDSFNSLDVDKEEIDEYRVKWNLLLENHKITGQITEPDAMVKNNNVLKFPLENYQCWFNYSLINEGDGEDSYIIGVYWKLIIGNDSVQKTITQQTTRDLFLARITILGYYKSPFENRIAVFTSSVSSFSGNVHFTPKLFGSNMSAGFN